MDSEEEKKNSEKPQKIFGQIFLYTIIGLIIFTVIFRLYMWIKGE